MKQEYINRNLLRSVCLLCLLWFFSACSVDEDMAECDFISKIRVVLYDQSLDASDIEKVELYVFGSDSTFLEKREVLLGEINEFQYPYNGQLLAFAIANANHGVRENVYAAPDSTLYGSRIEMIKIGSCGANEAIEDRPLCISPSMLFLGEGIAPNTYKDVEIVTDVPVHIIVGSARVTVRSLKEHLGTDSDGVSVLVLPKYSSVGFENRSTKEDVIAMEPAGTFVKQDEFEVEPFNFFSSDKGEAVEVYIFHDGKLIQSVDEDRHGNPLMAYNGKLLDILVDYGTYAGVSIEVMPWGEKHVWKEFD